jgi:hypothetical protein
MLANIRDPMVPDFFWGFFRSIGASVSGVTLFLAILQTIYELFIQSLGMESSNNCCTGKTGKGLN